MLTIVESEYVNKNLETNHITKFFESKKEARNYGLKFIKKRDFYSMMIEGEENDGDIKYDHNNYNTVLKKYKSYRESWNCDGDACYTFHSITLLNV
jgi:hypothetical protein